jgi:hypothetical protein
MYRTVHLALGCSLCLCAVAGANPITVSYYSGACTGTGSCDIAPSLPSQGFVLTDLIYGCEGRDLSIQEVSGSNVVEKARVPFNPATGITSYHLNSGIPFSGGSGIRTELLNSGSPELLRLTLVGYIPGTAATGSVPAVGGVGLAIMLVALLGAGALVLRRVRVHA